MDRLRAMAGMGVAVVGSINVDLAAFGSPLPRPGETVIGSDFSLVLGGKGANQAIAAVRAGAPTYMIGAVGEDMFRDLTLTTLAAEGIDVGGVRITDGATGIAHIRVDTASAQNDIMIIPNANHRLNPDDVEASLTKLGDRVSVVLVQLEIPAVGRAACCGGLPSTGVASGVGPGAGPTPATRGVARRLDGEAE